MTDLQPVGIYKHNGKTHKFSTSHLSSSDLTTNGTTTGPSSYVLNAGQVDKDKPSDFSELNPLGLLRARLTVLQDDVNGWLTERLETGVEGDREKRLLDGGESDSEEDGTESDKDSGKKLKSN